MKAIESYIQISCARHIRWLVDAIEINSNNISARGWAIPFGLPAECYKFYINGCEFDMCNWPISSQELTNVFNMLPSVDNARFSCSHPFTDLNDIFADGFARLDWCAAGRINSRSYRHAWYFPDPRSGVPIPDPHRIARVIGAPDVNSYLYGGATLHKRFDEYLTERFGKSLSSFASILDWGCGSGRLTRHLIGLIGPHITGCDIDSDNIGWCKANLKGGRFETIPLLPRTQFDNGEFDLVIGCSVFTHLSEDAQFQWLAELRRITATGGIVLCSIHGPSLMALLQTGPEFYAKIEKDGFFDHASNSQLDGVVEGGYYRNVTQSRDYILARWSEYFDVIDIVDAIAANQDVVVMRKR